MRLHHVDEFTRALQTRHTQHNLHGHLARFTLAAGKNFLVLRAELNVGGRAAKGQGFSG